MTVTVRSAPAQSEYRSVSLFCNVHRLRL